MAVSQETRKALYERAGGQCECTMTVCSHHKGRCPHKLNPGWEAHHRTAGGPDTLSNLIYKTAARKSNSFDAAA